jgi:hypothetical protein
VKRWSLCVIVAASVLMALAHTGEAAASRGRVKVILTDLFGSPVRGGHIEFGDESGVVRKVNERSQELILDYGVYRMYGSAPGFRSEERRVRVYSPKMLAVMSLSLGSVVARPRREVRGRFVGLPTNWHNDGEVAYVKLIPVFGQVTAEASVDRAGEFVIAEFDPGEHLLLFIIKDRVVLDRRVRLIQDREILEIPLYH